MKLSAHLNEHEIKEAIRRYIAAELGGNVEPNGVRINMHPKVGNDPREFSYVDATVEYTK